MKSKLQQNAHDLEQEMAWFSKVLVSRLRYTKRGENSREVFHILPPDLSPSESPYAKFLKRHELDFTERLAVVTSLVAHLRPHLLQPLEPLPQFNRKPFQANGHTLAFLIAGDDLIKSLQVQRLFDSQRFLVRQGILRHGVADVPLETPLILSEEYLSRFTVGELRHPQSGPLRPLAKPH